MLLQQYILIDYLEYNKITIHRIERNKSSSVPRNVLKSILYLILTSTYDNNIREQLTFADDIAILSVGKDHVTNTSKRKQQNPVNINIDQIVYANSAKYRGIIFDARLRWEIFVKKREEMQILDRHSRLPTYKILLYKQLIKPVRNTSLSKALQLCQKIKY